jgi:hypothetical protein
MPNIHTANFSVKNWAAQLKKGARIGKAYTQLPEKNRPQLPVLVVTGFTPVG